MSQNTSANSAGQQAGRALIYVIDDEPMLLELATVVLEPLGYQIRTFRDPETAIRAFTAAEPRPGLIITDYAMHTMNGLDLIAACRRLQPRQRILLLSGTVDEHIYSNVAAKPDRFFRRAQLVCLVRRPIADAAVVRHDARAGFEREQPVLQLHVEIGQ